MSLAGKSFPETEMPQSGKSIPGSGIPPAAAPLSHQLSIMLRRNTTLQIRCWGSTLAQAILIPTLFSLLLFVLQRADYANQSTAVPHPPAVPLAGVPQCQGRNQGDPCVSIMYTPDAIENGVDYSQIMRSFAAINSRRSGHLLQIEPPLSSTNAPSRIYDIVPVPDPDFIYNYAISNPNSTAWGVSFSQTAGPKNLQYQIWFNATATANKTDIFGRSVLAFTRGLDEAILSVLSYPSTSDKAANIDIAMKDWPTTPPSQLFDTIVGAIGPVFFFCSEMIIFINVLNQIVSEKEFKLRHGMEVMGLSPAIYWLSQFISTSAIVIINALSTCIWGLIFGFQAFKNADFGVLLITFILFGEAMILLAFFITTLVRKSSTAVLVGIFIFIIGLIFQSFVFSGPQLGYIWWSPETISPLGWKILSIVPFFNFGHMFLDITSLTTGIPDLLTSTYIPGPGFPWSALYESVPKKLTVPYGGGNYPNLPQSIEAWYFLIMDCFIFGALLWYLDNVIPNEFGAAEPLWFFLLPSYWGFEMKSMQSTDLLEWQRRNSSGATAIQPEGDEDSDVMAARDRALDTNVFPALKILNLRKIYYKNLFSTSPFDKVAVRNLCLTVEQDTLLALLGQNGAGKSTTISMLSGLTPATSGDALIYNMSVRHQMRRIRKIMGICPQHDILFNDLTAKEHIELYAGLKGVPAAQMEPLIKERLKAVRLDTVANVRAGTYSGGMKRRLSLVISTIGDPQIIFMDEPTTGMDPVNRRHVWTFIEKFKHGRVIILTTHSMEEADVLGDSIAIMSKGRLRAINNAIALKTKFGAGYRISIVTDHTTKTPQSPSSSATTITITDTERVKDIITSFAPDAILEDDSAGSLLYQLPASSMSSIPEVIKWLEANPENLVKSWGISQSTLEEVFLKLIRESNLKFA